MRVPALAGMTTLRRWAGAALLAVVLPAISLAQYSPADGSNVSGTVVSFSWPADAFVTNPFYRLEVGHLPSLADARVFPVAAPTTATGAQVGGLVDNGDDVYWRVTVLNANLDVMSRSPVQRFVNGFPFADCTPTLVAPVNGAHIGLPQSLTYNFSGTQCGSDLAIIFSRSPNLQGSDNVTFPVAAGTTSFLVTNDVYNAIPFRNIGTFYWAVATGSSASGTFVPSRASKSRAIRVSAQRAQIQASVSSIAVNLSGDFLRQGPEQDDAGRSAIRETLLAKDTDLHYLWSEGEKLRLEPVVDMVVVRTKDGELSERHLERGSLQSLAGSEREGLHIYRGFELLRLKGGLPGNARSMRDDALDFTGSVYRYGDRIVGMTDRLTADFPPDWTRLEIESLAADLGLRMLRPVRGLKDTYDFTVLPDAGRESLEIANELIELGVSKAAAPELLTRYESFAVNINDPLYPNQWHLNSTGQNIFAVPDADLNAPEAWELSLGAGTRIAVLDSGFDTDHEDIRYLIGYDSIDNDLDTRPEDSGTNDAFLDENHGTSVAGVAAAIRNNKGGVGVAPDASVIPGRFLVPGLTTDSGIRDAFIATTMLGADVSNNSWGPGIQLPEFCTFADAFINIPALPGEFAGLNFALTQGRGGLGSVVVFAAGNERLSVDGMALNASTEVLTVASSNDQNRRSVYSNSGSRIDVAAPSNDFFPFGMVCANDIWTGGTLGITTPDRTGNAGYNPTAGDPNDYFDRNYTATFGGTSSAAPAVAGVAALVLGISPNLTRQQVHNIITSTATKIDQANGQYNAQGHSRFYGFGKVNAAGAVQVASTVGNVQVRQFDVSNTGNAPLYVEDIIKQGNSPWITAIEPRSFVLSPELSRTITVRFDARQTSFGSVNDTLVILSSDPITGGLTIPVSFNRSQFLRHDDRVVSLLLGENPADVSSKNEDTTIDAGDVPSSR